jgi:hypothetical protein
MTICVLTLGAHGIRQLSLQTLASYTKCEERRRLGFIFTSRCYLDERVHAFHPSCAVLCPSGVYKRSQSPFLHFISRHDLVRHYFPGTKPVTPFQPGKSLQMPQEKTKGPFVFSKWYLVRLFGNRAPKPFHSIRSKPRNRLAACACNPQTRAFRRYLCWGSNPGHGSRFENALSLK